MPTVFWGRHPLHETDFRLTFSPFLAFFLLTSESIFHYKRNNNTAVNLFEVPLILMKKSYRNANSPTKINEAEIQLASLWLDPYPTAVGLLVTVQSYGSCPPP